MDILDLSEMQPAWLAGVPVPDDDPENQGGEGRSAEDMYPLNLGGTSTIASSVFAAGTDPVYEDIVPYQNREGVLITNDDGFSCYADVHGG